MCKTPCISSEILTLKPPYTSFQKISITPFARQCLVGSNTFAGASNRGMEARKLASKDWKGQKRVGDVTQTQVIARGHHWVRAAGRVKRHASGRVRASCQGRAERHGAGVRNMQCSYPPQPQGAEEGVAGFKNKCTSVLWWRGA